MPTGLVYDCSTGETTTVPYTPAPTPVPASVTPRQAKLALLAAGHLTNVEAAIAAANTATQINWREATEFLRTDPLVGSIGAGLGLTSSQIDDLFKLAATL